MSQPDFARARRQLRRARIEDAFGLSRQVNVSLYRDRLLELLAAASDDIPQQFDALDEATVDLVVSMAVAEVDESDIDTLSIVLMCVRVLAADGQFARLGQLNSRLKAVGQRFEIERPYLAATCIALAQTLKGDRDTGRVRLDAILGLRRSVPPTRSPRSRESIDDIVAAAALRDWLAGRGISIAVEARKIAINRGSGLLLMLLDVIVTYANSAESADCIKVVTEADSTFTQDKLQRYLERRKIETLFPSQISAITAGATSDQSMVVALPTSSGKTFLAELRIAASLTRHVGSRALYVAPYRLLARQVEQSLSVGLRPLKLSVRDLGSGFDPSFESATGVTGATSPTFYPAFNSEIPDVVICTPERLDALMRLSTTEERGATAARQLLESLSVVVFDELQLIGRPGRGQRFEMLLTRLRWRYPELKILGLSAASHGTEEIAQWLTGTDPATGGQRPTGTLELLWRTNGQVVQRVSRYPSTTVAHLDRGNQPIDDAAQLAIRFSSAYQPILILETSRLLTENVSKRVADLSPAQGGEWRDNLPTEYRHEIDIAVQETKVLLGDTHPLAELLRFGIAYHHAGVPSHLLRHIENLANKGLLRVLAATTTVAEGADLPFRVVIIPHLNFPSQSGRLEPDLYLNIVGRAGRANVAMEGIVVILNSDARNLKDVVRSSLWTDVPRDQIRGGLADIAPTSASLEDWTTFQEVQSQALAWLTESGAGLDNQAEQLASRTLSWQEGTSRDRRRIVQSFDGAFADLESRGLALAASPLRPTVLGRRVSLGGLSAPSAIRLNQILSRQRNGWLGELEGASALSDRQANAMAALVFETAEVISQGLWLRHRATRRDEHATVISALIEGQRSWPYEDELYLADIGLLAAWILGGTFSDISELAPIFSNKQSLFGGDDTSKRASDAAEYVGRVAYPAGWVWSAARILLGEHGQSLPWFLRPAVELGLPTEAACMLLIHGGLTRNGALSVSRKFSTSWLNTASQLSSLAPTEIEAIGLSKTDEEQLFNLIERLQL